MKNKELIESYFKWGILSLITIVILYKIFISNFDFSQIEITFTDILSLILSIFAMWLSINFYHKTNEVSNNFYDNTYNFTKNISETLGRMEERFGEKLESLKEENKHISSRIERYYNFSKNPEDKKLDEKKEKEVEEKLNNEIEARDKLYKELATKYNIAEQDRIKFVSELESKNRELYKLHRKLELFEKNKIPTRGLKVDTKYDIPSRIIGYFKKLVKDDLIMKNIFQDTNFEAAKDFFITNEKNVNRMFLRDLEKYDLIDSDKRLTNRGFEILNDITNN